jgi:adiponectin receptor
LIPGVIFLAGEGAIYRYFQAKYPTATVVDHIIFALFLLTAATCLGLSAAYHTLMNHSSRVSHLWLQLDLVGIVILTLGEFVSGIYFGFYCKQTLQRIYWAMVYMLPLPWNPGANRHPTQILTLSLVTIFLLLIPKFQGPRWRTFRVCAFVATGLSGFVPLAHGIKIYGFVQMQKQSGMPYYLGEGFLLILGAIFYTVSIETLNTLCGLRKMLIVM